LTIAILRPNAEGDLSQLYVFPSDGVHWNKVAEETPDEDATYVHKYGGVIGSFYYDNYDLANLGPGASITNVQVVARVRRIAQNPGGAYPTLIRLGVRISGSDYRSDNSVGGNSYVNTSRNYATNPDTGLAWTLADINSLQILLGLRMINMALWQGGFISGRCTQTYVQVTYSAIVAPTATTDPATEVT